MKLLVLGATGATGREVVAQALAAGHEITAVARNAAALADLVHERLQVVEGDVHSAPFLTQHMEQQDAVIIALGARSAWSGPTDLL